MAEKTLNTRIKLRYASYSEWQTSNLVLLPGEVALCYIEANNSEIKNSAPTVLFKVGDNQHTFKDLQWGSARAADVYDWAKAENLTIEKAGNGNVVASIRWDTTAKKFVYETASVATAEGLQDLQNTVATLTTNLNNLTERVSANETAISGLNTEVGKKVSQTDYDTKVEELSNAIGLNAQNIAKEATDRQTAITTAINKEVGDRNTAIETAVNSEKALREAADQALAGRIKVYEDNKDTYAIKTEVNEAVNAINGKISTIEGNISDANDEIDGAKDRLDVAEGKITTLIGADADKSVRTIANEELVKQLIPSTAAESLNTLEEIAQWIQDHPEDASEMNEKINANAAAIEKLNGADTVDGSVAKAVKAEADRAKGEEEKLAGNISTLQSYFDNGVAKNAKDADTLDGKDSTYFATKSEHDTLSNTVGTINSTVGQHTTQIGELTPRVAQAEEDIEALEGDLSTLQGTVNTISSDLDKAEEAIKAIQDDYLVEEDKTELSNAIANEKQRAELAESGLGTRIKAIEDDNTIVRTVDTLILDCGSYQ